ncbi:sulfotransferase 1B1-like [Oculina patagonica]
MDDMVIVHGIPWTSGQGITEEKVEALTRLPAREDDIFIVSFPRSGLTWTQEIVWQIIHDGKIDDRRLDVRVPYIEGMILPIKSYPYTVEDAKSVEKMFKSFPAPRVFKTHLPYDLVPKGRDKDTKPRYIYVMRNPKDVCVSQFHHYRNMPYMREISTWDEAFERFMNGRVRCGVWFDHVLNWWKHRDDPNILFLSYEDRIKDPAEAVDKIARFIGRELSPETRDLIVQQTSFGAMKSSGHTNYSWFEGVKGDGFIRKGQVGEWKDFFTEEQNQLFDKVFKEKMEGSGLMFEFES